MNDKNAVESKPLRTAVMLLWASLVIGLVIGAMDADPELAGVSTAFIMGVLAVVFGVMSLLIYCIGRGKNWARITFLVLFVLGLVPYATNLMAMFDRSVLVGALSVAQFLMQVTALYLIFTKPGALSFQKTVSAPTAAAG